MKKRKNNNLRFLIVTLIIMLFLGVLQNGTGFSSGIFDLVSVGLSNLTAAAKSTPDSAEDELSVLKKENTELRKQLMDYLDLKTENERLLRYFKITKQKPGLTLMPANITARNPDDDFGEFIIDAGVADGVKQGDPVITENGLAGQVGRAGFLTSTVTTLLSPKLKISAADKLTGDEGIVGGRVGLNEKNQTAFGLLDENNKVKPGDLITTGGGEYPENLMIGVVTGVKRDPFSTLPYAAIKLPDDIKSIKSVAVITGYSTRKGEKTDEGG
jgi:rod shape-determining protein MreC